MRRYRHIQHFDCGIGDQVAPIVIDAGDAAGLGYFARLFGTAGGDGGDVISGVPISDKLDIAHDKAGADDADGIVAIRRPRRLMVEIETSRCGYVYHVSGGNACQQPPFGGR